MVKRKAREREILVSGYGITNIKMEVRETGREAILGGLLSHHFASDTDDDTSNEKRK